MIAVPKNVLPDVALIAAMTVVRVDNISRYLERSLLIGDNAETPFNLSLIGSLEIDKSNSTLFLPVGL